MGIVSDESKIYILDQPVLVPEFLWKVEKVSLDAVRSYVGEIARRKKDNVVVSVANRMKVESISRLVGVDFAYNYTQDDENVFSPQIIFNDDDGSNILMIRRVGRI